MNPVGGTELGAVLGPLATTLRVSLASTAIASILSLPAGFLLALHAFPGKRVVLSLLRTALAVPTVLVGLVVYAAIARQGPLGHLELLFTPAAMVIGQVLLITPLVTALVHGVLASEVLSAHEEAVLLGSSPLAAFWQTLGEARVGISTALLTGFGRVASEIGVSLILGGNIAGYTRTLTTSIALETGRGEIARAATLGVVLLVLVLAVNLAVQLGGARATGTTRGES